MPGVARGIKNKIWNLENSNFEEEKSLKFWRKKLTTNNVIIKIMIDRSKSGMYDCISIQQSYIVLTKIKYDYSDNQKTLK